MQAVDILALENSAGRALPPDKECCYPTMSDSSPSTPRAPTREDIHEMMRDLANGTRSIKAVADWADPWIFNDTLPEIEDDIVWDAVNLLAQADTPGDPGQYLFKQEDFEEWLREFEEECR